MGVHSVVRGWPSSWRRVDVQVDARIHAKPMRESTRNVKTMAVPSIQAIKAASVEDNTKTASFPVYIEDTDCFQVVFYANYFHYFMRLLSQALNDENKPWTRYHIVAIDNAKYARAARLGDMLHVRAEELEVIGDQFSGFDDEAVRRF